MKTKFIIAMLFFSKIITAQSKINYGIYVQPKLSTFVYEESRFSNAANTLSYLIGGSAAFQHEKFEFKTGINVSRTSINQIDYTLVFGSDINGINGPDIYKSFTRDNLRIFYVGIPLSANYYFTKKENLYLNLGGEILLKVFDSNKSFLVESGLPERELSENGLFEPKNIIAKTNFGIGYLYKKENYAIYFEPVIEYSIIKIFKKTGLNNNINSIEFGFRFGFKI